jgi:hypothetical protein
MKGQFASAQRKPYIRKRMGVISYGIAQQPERRVLGDKLAIGFPRFPFDHPSNLNQRIERQMASTEVLMPNTLSAGQTATPA